MVIHITRDFVAGYRINNKFIVNFLFYYIIYMCIFVSFFVLKLLSIFLLKNKRTNQCLNAKRLVFVLKPQHHEIYTYRFPRLFDPNHKYVIFSLIFFRFFLHYPNITSFALTAIWTKWYQYNEKKKMNIHFHFWTRINV